MIDSIEYARIRRLVPRLCVDVVVLDSRGRVLLGRRVNEPMKGQWWIPGGAVILGESLESALYRKLLDETGITMSLVWDAHQAGVWEWIYGDGTHDVNVAFVLRLTSSDVRTLGNGEHSLMSWFQELPDIDHRLSDLLTKYGFVS